MARGKFKSTTEYLHSKWEDNNDLKSVSIRLHGKFDAIWLAGWLTAHTTMDSNCIDFSSNTMCSSEQIAKECEQFAKELD